MTAAKKPRAKRPPRKVWHVMAYDGTLCGYFTTRRKAVEECSDWERIRIARHPTWGPHRVVGPYILAERVRER